MTKPKVKPPTTPAEVRRSTEWQMLGRALATDPQHPPTVALQMLAELIAVRQVIRNAADPTLTVRAIADELCSEFGLELEDAKRDELAAWAIMAREKQSFGDLVAHMANTKKADTKPRRRVPVKTMAQVLRRLQQIPAELANAEMTAAQARAEVYTLQTLLVLLKASAPKQLQLPEMSAAADVTEPEQPLNRIDLRQFDLVPGLDGTE